MSDQTKPMLPGLPEPFDLPTPEDVFYFVAGNMNSVEFKHPIPEGATRPTAFSASDTYCMSAHDIASAVTFRVLFTEDQVTAIQLATWKAATESAARRCEWLARLLSGPHESDGEYAVYMGAAAAIRQAPEPGEGG